MKKYRKIPLSVEAVFAADGKLTPKKLYFGGEVFAIERIIGCHKHRPTGISCIAPLAFETVICGQYKTIYYESESGTWFSVREDTHGARDFTQ